MALKTFTATRAPAAGDGKWLKSWHLSVGITTALVANFCEDSAANPIFQVQLPISSSSSQSYDKPIRCPNGGRWHVEIVSGNFTRGAIDLI